MTNEQLTAFLAERVMGWTVGPDRFLTNGRRWIPRWRFQPARSLEDAFRLLDAVQADEYTMGSGQGGRFLVNVTIAGRLGHALDESKPRAITLAIARALGVEVDSLQ